MGFINMNERIKMLADMTVKGQMYIEHTKTEYNREDIFLSPVIMSAKRSKEYILNQKPFVSELTALTGYLRFKGDVMGDIFNRCGHDNFQKMMSEYYNKPIDGLCTFEWQHSVADFEKVIKIGIDGLKAEITQSRKTHSEKEELEFLDGLDMIADAIIGWAEKCSDAAFKKAQEIENPEYKANLVKLSKALKNVPAKPAQSFYEAVLTIYVIYAFVPDSIGTIDRYLYSFYVNDIADGTLTREDAKAYLQELFLMLQARISIKSDRFYRGGESHFCIGGYLENGEDGFNELSMLILDSMIELPTWIPQISLRWTKKTPEDVLKYVMDCERKDPNKRIAFVNDEPRIKAFMEIAGFPHELACKYTMVGCNEPQLPGGIFMGGCKTNIAKSIENTIYNCADEICNTETFDEFYTIYERELCKTMEKAMGYYNKFQRVRARDVNLVSTMFFEGSIERAKSITQGGAKNAIADFSFMGIVTTIDSLAIIKQFVFDEKKVSMRTIVDALKANWKGYEELHDDILKQGKFFGNDDENSNDCANRFATSVSEYLKDKETDMGYKFMIGNLIGYNQHHKWFGELTKASPDGRYNGDMISYGISQNDGKDREGLTALLSSVAKINASSIFCGQTVTNVLVDDILVKDDNNFDKLVKVFETYFKLGGLHFQLNYVSKQDLKNAQIAPEKYKNLRVRVSGFSDYFVFLNEDLQAEIITRTEKEA
ncbi:MAG: hypothetical protein E7017_07935 [Alphaproteobacteria bacterium]|nr:hypothetical protein [Alphaproteobacteria bacterium]